MKAADLAVFLLYLSGVVFFGLSFFRRNKTPGAYTLGNRDVPAWVVGMSIFATFVSSISYLALPGQAYQTNWNPLVFSFSLPFAAWMAVKFFVPLYRSVKSPSAYTWLEMRFGRWAKYYASSMYLLTQLMRTGTILFLLALMLNSATGWDIAIVISITGICVILYSMLGGIRAVLWTDAVQGILLVTGAVVCALILTFSIPGGPERLFSVAAGNNKFSLGSIRPGFTESTFWVVLIYGIFINLQNFGIDQNYIQRYLAARSDSEAKKSALFGALIYIPVSLLFLYIGTALFSFYTVRPDLLPAGVTGDRVFPYFIFSQLPPGLAGLLVSSVFAAGMSTISTSVNSSATVLLMDYFTPKGMGGSRRKQMTVLYVSSAIFGLLGIGIGIAMINVQSALDAWWKLASVFSGGMLGLFLLGFFNKRVTSGPAIAGTLAGVIMIAWISLSPVFLTGTLEKYACPLHGYMAIVAGTTVIVLTGFLGGVVLKEKVESRVAGGRTKRSGVWRG